MTWLSSEIVAQWLNPAHVVALETRWSASYESNAARTRSIGFVVVAVRSDGEVVELYADGTDGVTDERFLIERTALGANAEEYVRSCLREMDPTAE